jgi:hypothetical protein
MAIPEYRISLPSNATGDSLSCCFDLAYISKGLRSRILIDQRLAYFVDLGAQLQRLFTEAMLVTRTGRTSRADYGCRFLAAFGYPADIQYLTDTLKLRARFRGNLAAAAARVATLFNRIDGVACIDVLGTQCGREINAGAKHMPVASRIPGPHRLAGIETLVIAAA